MIGVDEETQNVLYNLADPPGSPPVSKKIERKSGEMEFKVNNKTLKVPVIYTQLEYSRAPGADNWKETVFNPDKSVNTIRQGLRDVVTNEQKFVNGIVASQEVLQDSGNRVYEEYKNGLVVLRKITYAAGDIKENIEKEFGADKSPRVIEAMKITGEHVVRTFENSMMVQEEVKNAAGEVMSTFSWDQKSGLTVRSTFSHGLIILKETYIPSLGKVVERWDQARKYSSEILDSAGHTISGALDDAGRAAGEAIDRLKHGRPPF